ncbi:hypothetical protein [Halegenticoccus tardaugens]|uniref:hypothetical protein n=1 Tax=Halegenticoccus tardaugens TaxID=2071624 RepID=UPI00100BB41B|nr:hypothetical protein [Halegenticoccus tardaugens]
MNGREVDDGRATGGKTGGATGDDVPTWEDPYLDRVSDRLMHNYDLTRDEVIDGERFDLYGRMRIESQKHLFHPVLNYANHGSEEHLFARRAGRATARELESLVDLGHRLGDEWIEPSEEHFSTDFTFALVVPRIPADVREFVSGFSDRTLLKYGYYGHYEINLLVVAPEEEAAVGSRNADVIRAFRLWRDVPAESPGLFARVFRRFGRS